MGYRVLASPLVLSQIRETAAHLKDDLGLPRSATALLDRVEEVIGIMESLPRSFPLDEEAGRRAGGEIRWARVGSYKLYFDIDDDGGAVRLQTFRHFRQNPRGLPAADLSFR